MITTVWLVLVIAALVIGFSAGHELAKRNMVHKRLVAGYMEVAHKIALDEKVKVYLEQPDNVGMEDLFMGRVDSNIFTDGREN